MSNDGRATLVALRALGLGDALTGIPALRGLRRGFPGHRLVLAAPAGVGQWLRGLGIVDELVVTAGLEPVNLPAGQIAVNLHGRGPQSNRLLLATRPSRLIAFRDPEGGQPEGPHWSAQEHEVDRWCRLVRTAGGACDREDLRLSPPAGVVGRGSQVVVHPGAASAARRWPAERWRKVILSLRDARREVVVTGGSQERALCAEVCRGVTGVQDLSGRLSLPELAELVAGAAMMICGDTGVAHLATAYATPSVLLFGPTPPRLWGPAIDQQLHRVLWHGTDAHADPTGPGPNPHADVIDPALDRITVPEVIAAEAELMAEVTAVVGYR
jgi:glycosyl transferase family 9 (putative heptosyltransferase)